MMCLAEVLRFLDSSSYLRNLLALKGGTAINLLFFDLPRMSVDIDLDFCVNVNRSDMFDEREKVQDQLLRHMTASGYTLSSKSKMYHSLRSYIFDYVNAGGAKDHLKIEINYSLRSHILPMSRMVLSSNIVGGGFEVNCVAPIEIYATKTVALLTRGAARDLYDMNYLVKSNMFSISDLEMYRKCVIFYLAVSTENPITNIQYSSIDEITLRRIKTDLRPVMRDRDVFELDAAKVSVKEFLDNALFMKECDVAFLNRFSNKEYCPELLFDDQEILARIRNHPMALWKCSESEIVKSQEIRVKKVG